MSGEKKPLILVDGSSYLYRAFHALPALTNSKGAPTGAIFGMVSMLKKLMADYQPELMAVVFDAKGKNFRDDIYEGYKATRKEMPNELSAQIEPIFDIIRALGIPIIVIPHVEADDVIGTLCQIAKAAGFKTLVSTSDKDLAQLVDEDVTLVNTMSNTILNPQGVLEKFGITPALMIDYLTLVGDTSDNIPGVPQVGPKTAAKWLQQYGSLNEIILNADKITGKVGEKLRENLSQLPLTKSLVTIKLDVPLTIQLSDLTLKPANQKELIKLYTEAEFKNWLSELLALQKETHAEKHTAYEIIDSEEALKKLVEKLKNTKQFSFHVAATQSNRQSKIVGISIAISNGVAFYIPIQHDHSEKQLALNLVLNYLKPFFENRNIQKITHNIKYIFALFKTYQITLTPSYFDIMLESYLLDSTSNNHDIDSLALKYLGWRTINYEEIAGKNSKEIPFSQLDIKVAATYSAERADLILRLHEVLWPRIEKSTGLKYIFENIELPLSIVLAKMEFGGVLIDPIKLQEHSEYMQTRLTALEQEVYQLAGKEFNLNSPKQLQEILFQTLKLPILQKTPTGQPSTADHVLQELALEFAIPHLIIEHRSLSKLISTYTNRLIEQMNPETKRIHTSYNQTVTSTGRLSSSDPNLQNIPIRSAEGRRIRQTFVAETGFKILSADYSQIELRLMAHISQDPNLLHAFQNNIDIHTATASEVWEVELEKVTADMRRNAKAINFGLIYGMSAFGLTRQIGVDRKSAQEYIDRYFARYPNVKQYMENTRKKAKEEGYVETLWGRRLYIPDINASQIPRQKAAERAAINAPLQGSAADIIKMAMIEIHQWIELENYEVKMVMQVHDELVFEVRDEDIAIVTEKIRQSMMNVAKLRVPLLVSIGIGEDWDVASTH